ncbi:hypothetical protein E0Z10_g7098 [Xylaria hypoxylon]|uniref:DUF4211 domain-containing protein n=1 Tax=Xylaria hypoxylon TaxID=37992 RepID=A0A4Z0YEP3_9PEZI|nr:hypothetical protein E0Z10_g7098 [Xylaria hypoxylon]
MPPRKKQQSQARLTFEPIGASSSSPVSTYSPARVRYSRTAHSSAAARPSSMATPSSLVPNVRRSNRKQLKQGRLDDSIGTCFPGFPRPITFGASTLKGAHSRYRVSPDLALLTPSAAPPASFMPNQYGGRNRPMANDSSDDSAAEIGDAGYAEDDVDLLPPTQKASKSHTSETSDCSDSDEEPSTRNPRSSQSVSTRFQRAVIVDDSDDEELEPPRLSSPRKRQHSSIISIDDSDDAPILTSNIANSLSRSALIELDDSDDDIVSPSKKRKIVHHSSPNMPANNCTPGRLKRPGAAISSPIKKPHKGHRSEKQKKMELLRRRRAGEKISQLTSSESSSGEDEKRGIYDSDSGSDFEVLKEFDDEEQGEVVQEQIASRGDKHKRKREKPTDKEISESNLDDFVTDDSDSPLGAPVDIPLEFTSHAHKPLKDQFPFVIEWLVHNRINPAFERKDPVYVNAWRKLGDEVSGLANSKFTSSAWKLDFNRALKSRPRLETFPLGQIGSGLYETCEACGRSGHPSTFKIVFSGSPYYKDTLEEVESDSDSEGEDDNDTASVDSRATPKQLIAYFTGNTRSSEREKMKAKRRRALANSIVDEWQERRVVTSLYGDFKNTLENARNQATTGRGARGKFR